MATSGTHTFTLDISDIMEEAYDIAVEFVPEKTSAEKKFTSKLQQYRERLVKKRRCITKSLFRISSPYQTAKLHQEPLNIE